MQKLDKVEGAKAEVINYNPGFTPNNRYVEILEIAKDILSEKDITLKIVEFTDYVRPNNVVESGEIDANYFQHVPYLDDFNNENGTHIVSVGGIHVEPMGIYGGKQTNLDAIKG